MTRRINAAGLSLIKKWEGLRLDAYRDVAGVMTIGYGHTSAAGMPKVSAGMVISEKEADRILQSDLAKFEERVNRLVKVPLTDNQFAALVSFDFNTGQIHSSTLLKRLNEGRYEAVPSELARWIKATDPKTGKKLTVAGLVNRRAAEAGLWVSGAFVSSNHVTADTATNKTDVATISGAGAAGVAVTVGPAIPDVVKAITDQQNELSSGDWFRIAVSVAILGLTLWGVYLKVKR